MHEKQVSPAIMKAGKGELWRLCCGSLHDSKLYPSWCTKAAALLVVTLLSFGLMLQEGMVDTYNSVRRKDMVLGATGSIIPVNQSESTSRVPMSSSKDDMSRLLRSPAAKCLSRDQHMLHRPASQIIPSSAALVSALKVYEKRHAECSKSVGQNWTETFLQSLNGSSLGSSSDCQFLVFIEGGAGLGNRLISLVSAFVFALFTDRVLLVELSAETGHVANLLCEPFPDSTWILPDGFPLDLLYNAPDVNKAVNDNFNGIENVLRLNLDHSQNCGDQRFFCSETRERIREIDWVMWTSNQYFVPRLLTFPEFWPRLSTLFPNPSHVFTHLSRYLLLPSNNLWEKIFRIYSSYLSSAENLVGIQIRRHSVPDSGEYSALAFERVLNCLTHHHILPNVSSEAPSFPKERLLEWMMKVRPSSSSRELTKDVQKHQRENGGPVVTSVLIASLQQTYAEELQDLYANFPTTDGTLVRVHIVSHERMEWHSYDQAQKAFVEMWLLSLSDTIATSSVSTFGYVAQGLGALTPYIVNLRGDLGPNVEEDPAPGNLHCVVGYSPEPCNHYSFWPKMDCGNETSRTPAHEAWIEKHLRPCQDSTSGLQLVNIGNSTYHL